MKTLFAAAGSFLLCAPLLAAEADPRDQIKAGAKKLAEKPNYSWTATMRADGGEAVGTTEGQTEKGGTILLKVTFGERIFEAVIKGEKAAFKGENDWESTAELGEERAWIARRLQTFKAPAKEAQDLATKTKSLRLADGAHAGELTEEGAREYVSLSRRFANPMRAKGSVRFWLKDGELAKYEYNVQGTVMQNNEEVTLNRTTTVEIRNVGSTKLSLPEGAKKKL